MESSPGANLVFNRRRWLQTVAAGWAASTVSPRQLRASGRNERPKVAAVLTEFTYRSHAHVILENFLEPYYFNGQVTESGMDVVALYVDQFPEGKDMARDVARQYGITIYPTIGEALRCGGSDLAVDGVLSIGEHGTYPDDERGVKMYPRKRFFDEITAVFRQSRRVVPLFNDKHLTYRWDWAADMMDVVHELNIPFMAGSSVPLAQRRPPIEIPADAVIQEAVAVHGGPLEAYDFHGMELLQSMVEFRKGGETGVESIQLLEGDAIWQAAEAGRWNPALALKAMQAELGSQITSLKDFIEPSTGGRQPLHVILITYRDGLKGAIVRIGQSATRWNFACQLAGQPTPLATSLYVGPWMNRNLFKALAHAIQAHIREQQAPYPAERTYLVTGMLAAAIDSRFQGHQLLPTPHLAISYAPRDFRSLRESGATWKLITEDQPEPRGIAMGIKPGTISNGRRNGD